MCSPRPGVLPYNLLIPLFHKKSALPVGWDHRMHQVERSSGGLQPNLLLQGGSGCSGHYQSSLTFPQTNRFYNCSRVFILLVPNWNLLFPKLCPCASLSVPFPHPAGRICDSPSLDDQQPGALRIIKPTSLFHIHLSDRKGAPFTMEMKHKHAEKTVHEVNGKV